MVGLVHDAFGIPNMNFTTDSGQLYEDNQPSGPHEETKDFLKLLLDVEYDLYLGCGEFTKLSFSVHLLQLKVVSGWTDTSFTMLLELIKRAFPKPSNLPKSFYEAKVIVEDLEFTYQTWDVEYNHRTNNMQFYEEVRTLSHGPSLKGDDFETNLIPKMEPYSQQQLDDNIGFQVDDNVWMREGVEAMTLDTDAENNHTRNYQNMENVDNM
ncbi:hypothetical protein ACH5RR_013082 [Cinchona calisaya]|uniref:Uncharacterized protein n=1 Tax=Cinchona calisaya TaxID=153742 RepID=A0ABD3A2B3_9GENT